MIVIGQAGSEKTRLHNTIVTTIRKMFKNTNASVVFAPTRDAADGVGGETMHKFAFCSVGGKISITSLQSNRIFYIGSYKQHCVNCGTRKFDK